MERQRQIVIPGLGNVLMGGHLLDVILLNEEFQEGQDLFEQWIVWRVPELILLFILWSTTQDSKQKMMKVEGRVVIEAQKKREGEMKENTLTQFQSKCTKDGKKITGNNWNLYPLS